ncbi:MAG TPA: hypothetical protein VFY06_07710 [Verrucomicrobiae bacterium]|nr:hypothetical protein [Verrucomicrobiae bacterium]
MTQPLRLSGQNDEDRLGDFLGLMRVAHVPQRDGIDQVDMPRHQFAERLVGMAPDELAQQRAVIHGLHLRISVRRAGKGDNYFAPEWSRTNPAPNPCLARQASDELSPPPAKVDRKTDNIFQEPRRTRIT